MNKAQLIAAAAQLPTGDLKNHVNAFLMSPLVEGAASYHDIQYDDFLASLPDEFNVFDYLMAEGADQECMDFIAGWMDVFDEVLGEALDDTLDDAGVAAVYEINPFGLFVQLPEHMDDEMKGAEVKVEEGEMSEGAQVYLPGLPH